MRKSRFGRRPELAPPRDVGTAAHDIPRLGLPEFVGLMALITSLVALATDAMLPALPAIGGDLGVVEPNNNQLVVSAFFLGFAVGQIFYGPISDSLGRKPVIYVGLGLFVAGCVLSVVAQDFTTMLAARVLQGVGAAGPRTVSLALIRDLYEGRAMARIMSFIMAVFILVPMLAPALGQGILALASWRAIFVAFFALAAIGFAWFALRQPETLARAKRAPLTLGHIGGAALEVCRTRSALGYILAAGVVFGAFLGYLNSAQQIFQQQYALGPWFPLSFAVLSVAIGAAAIFNARLVMRYGMRFLSRRALIVVTGLSAAGVVAAALFDGHPPLAGLMAYCMATFFCMGILFGNLNALAMEPLGHIAGVGAAVVGAVTTLIALVLGTTVGLSYDGTVLPLVGGFALFGAIALALMHWAGAGRQEAATSS